MMFIVILSVVGPVLSTNLDLINILLTGDTKEIYKLPNAYKAVINSVSFLNKIQLSNQQKATIWDIIKRGRDPQQLTPEELRNITGLIPSIPEDDLSNLNVSDWNIVKILGQVRYFTRTQATAIVDSFKTHTLHADHINKLCGLICGFSEDKLSKISKLEFKKIDSNVFANLYACSESQLNILYKQIIDIYGSPKTWSKKLIKHIGMIILALDKDEIKTLIPSSVSGLDTETITKFKPQLLEALTSEQLKHLNINSKMQMGMKLFTSSSSQFEISLLMTLLLRAYLLLKF